MNLKEKSFRCRVNSRKCSGKSFVIAHIFPSVGQICELATPSGPQNGLLVMLWNFLYFFFAQNFRGLKIIPP